MDSTLGPKYKGIELWLLRMVQKKLWCTVNFGHLFPRGYSDIHLEELRKETRNLSWGNQIAPLVWNWMQITLVAAVFIISDPKKLWVLDNEVIKKPWVIDNDKVVTSFGIPLLLLTARLALRILPILAIVSAARIWRSLALSVRIFTSMGTTPRLVIP